MPQSPVAAPVDDADRAYVAPQATERVSAVPLRLSLDASTYGQKFSRKPGLPQVTIGNPYMDPARLVLSVPKHLQCTADGAVLVGGEGGIDANGRTIGIGFWRVAPDGAVTPLHTRISRPQGRMSRSICGAAHHQTHVGAPRAGVQPDGGLLFAHTGSVMRIRPDGVVERIAGSPRGCAPDNTPGIEGLTDGAADEARFKNLGRVVAGADGEAWVVDQGGCALRRVAADGRTTTVAGPDRLCAKGTPPAEQLLMQHLAWDPTRRELVSAGSMLTHNQLFTTVWRIGADGQTRRVLLGHKLGKSPAGAQLDGINGLAVDPQGRIHIGSRRMENDQLAVLRIDEARGSVVPVTGAALRAGDTLIDQAIDGPAERARFVRMQDLCIAPDGTTFVLDEILLRRLDRNGQVTTWAF